jgi:nucleoside triphosphate diphosphatase
MQPSRELSRLLEIMAALRDPNSGCPWDLEQTFASIRHYTIEEAYEVADAIEREDFDDLRDELGDLLFQPVYHAQMASERGLFDMGDVIWAITSKLIRRHPHVFGPDAANNAQAAKGQWEAIKAQERTAKAADRQPASILDDVPQNLPALARAEKLGKRAASVGFDWPDWQQIIAKCREELSEIEDAVASDSQPAVVEELGDLLLAVSSLSRKLGVDPEAALCDANAKFTRRFAYVETRARENGLALQDAGLDKLDAYWNEIRKQDKATHNSLGSFR